MCIRQTGSELTTLKEMNRLKGLFVTIQDINFDRTVTLLIEQLGTLMKVETCCLRVILLFQPNEYWYPNECNKCKCENNELFCEKVPTVCNEVGANNSCV